MSPLASFRAWVPEVALVMACVMAAGAISVSVGVHAWHLDAALAALSILVAGTVLRRRARRPEVPPARPATRMRVLPGGKAGAPYDLAKDDSTNSQRYLM